MGAALRTLDAAQAGVAADELDPGERLVAVEEIMVEGQHGVLIASTARLLAVYSTELLFKSFPTLQTLHYQHVLTAQPTGSRVYVYASPHPGGHRDEFEENTFLFHTPQVAAAFVGFLRVHCPRLAAAAASSAAGR